MTAATMTVLEEDERSIQAIGAKSAVDVAFYHGLPMPDVTSRLGGTDAEATAELAAIKARLDGAGVLYREISSPSGFGLVVDTGGGALTVTKNRDTTEEF